MHSFPPQDDNKFKTKAKTTSTANSGINSDFEAVTILLTKFAMHQFPFAVYNLRHGEEVGAGGQYGEMKKGKYTAIVTFYHTQFLLIWDNLALTA